MTFANILGYNLNLLFATSPLHNVNSNSLSICLDACSQPTDTSASYM